MHRVRLYLSTVVVLFLATVSAFAAPEAISDLTALETTTEGSVTLSWTSPGGGATGYLVKYAESEIFSTDLNASWTSTYIQSWPPASAGSPESHTLANLTPGVTYYFAVVAKDSGDNYGIWSGPSETGGECNSESSAVSFDAVPAPVAGVILGRGNTFIDLAWTANTETDIQDYRIECSSYSDVDGFTRAVTILAPGTTHYDSGLVNGNTYYYRVRAEDKTGHAGDFSLIKSTKPWITLGVPSLNATYSKAASTTTINWSFNPLASNASGYYIVCSTSGDRLSPDLGLSTTFWLQNNLAPNTTFAVYVQAFNGLVTSNSAPLRYYTLANPPSDLASTQTTTKIDLTWSHNNNDPSATRYTVRRSSDNIVYDVLMNLAYSTTCQDTGLLEGVTYYYKVWATNGDSAPDFSHYAFLSTTTPRILPAAPTIDDIGYGSFDGIIRLRWVASGEDGTANGPCSSYALKWATYAITSADFDAITSSASVAAARQFPSSEPDFYVSGLFPGTTYNFALKAIDHSGNLSTMSVDVWGWPALDSPPLPPMNVTATALSSSTVSVSWTKPSVPMQAYNDLDKYKVYRATFMFESFQADVSTFTYAYTSASPFTITDPGLVEETTYYYRVSVLDKGDQGNGLYSEVLESRLSDTTGYAYTPDTVPPGQITDLAAQPGSFEGKIALTWTSPGDNGYGNGYYDRPCNGKYRVDYSLNPLYSFTTSHYTVEISSFPPVTLSTTTVEMREITGLTAGGTYYIRVWAVDEAGNSGPLSAQTTAWAQWDVTPPETVNDLSATAAWNRAFLSWTAPGDAGENGAIGPVAGGAYEIRLSTEGVISDTATWNAVPGGHPYRISFTTSTVPGQRETYAVTGLTNGTTYYFALRTCDDRGNESEVSTVSPSAKPFNQPPDTFALTGPYDNFISTDGLPALTWAPAFDPDGVYGDTVSYVIQFATSSDFATYGTLSRSVNWGSPDLRVVYEDMTVYWRVLTMDLNGISAPSSTAYLRVRVNTLNAAPTSFALVSPASDTIIVTSTPTLTWDASSDPDPGDILTYQVDYSRSADFAACTSSSGLTAVSYVTPPLVENATYYWRVWACDGSTRTPCDVTFSFRVNEVPQSPDSFNLSGPDDNAVLSTTTAVFSWQAADDPDPGDSVSYDLTWSNVANFATSSTVTGLTGTTTTFYHFPENSVIYWFVTAVGSCGNRRQSSGTWHFYVDVEKELPGPFNLLEPGYNVIISTTLRPIFSWSKAIDPDPADDARYYFDMSPSANFSGLGTFSFGPSTDRFYIPAFDLTDQTTYYWRVRAAGYQGNPIPVKVDFPDEERYTFSSSTGVFVISMTNNPPQAFALQSPANGAVIATRKPVLRWGQAVDTDVNSVVRYTVTIATSADFGVIVASANDTLDLAYTPASPLLENRTYYWKAAATDNKGAQTACSAPFSFTVPVLSVPRAPSGLQGTLSANKMKFTIGWTGVTKNSNNTDIDDLVGYTVYRGLSVLKMNSYAFVPAGTVQWSDENTDGGNLYYRVRSVDSSGIESPAEDSPILNSLSSDALSLLSEDQSFDVEVPPAVSRYLLSANNPYHDDLFIKFERNTAVEAASDAVLYSYTLRVLSADGSVRNDISLAQPLTLRFNYGSGTGGPARLAAMKVPAAQLGELNVYWHNGIEFMRVGGTTAAGEQQVTLKTTRPGEYQLRRVSRAPGFGLASIYPPKVFTPGTAPYADIQFNVDNPAGDKVTGKIFDLRGDFVADMRAVGDATASSVILKWDGRTSDGDLAPKGVYLYQVEGSGKILNGTIMVAR